MAKYPEYPRSAHCNTCNSFASVTVELTRAETKWNGYKTVYTPSKQIITVNCQCSDSPQIINTAFQAKETPVAKQFDTTETKSLVLNTIISKVEQLERALYNRVEARAKLESMHAQHIADASTALDRVMAEAFQKGIAAEDLENHLPDYDEFLSERLIEAANAMSLANVFEGV